MVEVYEFGIDNSTATVVTTFMLMGGFWIVAFLLGQTCNIFSLNSRFPTKKNLPRGFPETNDVSLYRKIEAVTGSYTFAFVMFGLSNLFLGIVRSTFANSEVKDAGYEVCSRMSSFFGMIGLSSIALASSRIEIVGELPRYNVLLWFSRVYAALFDVGAIVLCCIDTNEDYQYLRGVLGILAFFPAFVTAIVSLKAHMSEDFGLTQNNRLGSKTTGRYLLAVAIGFTMIIMAVFSVGFFFDCHEVKSPGNCKCPFDLNFNQNFFYNLCWFIALVVYSFALLKIGNEPPSFIEGEMVKQNSYVENVPQQGEPIQQQQGEPIQQQQGEPVQQGEPIQQKPSEPIQQQNGEPVQQQEPVQNEDPDKNKDSKSETSTLENTLKQQNNSNNSNTNEASSTMVTANPAFDPNVPSGGSGIEGSLLHKMYKLFTTADDGSIDDADAGLTKEEFKARVTIQKLQEVLEPIGGIDLSRVDPKLTMAKGVKIPIDFIFETLDKDKNSRVTATEFIKLLRKKATKTWGIIEDSILRKLYDLFSKADSGRIDVADAGLTEYELASTVTVAELQKILEPIGGLNLASLGADSVEKVEIATIFRALDKNKDDRLTATEFIKLLRTSKGRIQTGQ